MKIYRLNLDYPNAIISYEYIPDLKSEIIKSEYFFYPEAYNQLLSKGGLIYWPNTIKNINNAIAYVDIDFKEINLSGTYLEVKINHLFINFKRELKLNSLL